MWGFEGLSLTCLEDALEGETEGQCAERGGPIGGEGTASIPRPDYGPALIPLPPKKIISPALPPLLLSSLHFPPDVSIQQFPFTTDYTYSAPRTPPPVPRSAASAPPCPGSDLREPTKELQV